MVEPALTPADSDRSGARSESNRSAADVARSGDRYSRFVSAMRIALPLIALVIVVLVVAWPQLGDKPKKFRVGMTDTRMEDSSGQQIVNARFTGTDSNGRPYTVTADTAEQQKQQPDFVEMAFPKADMSMKNGAWVVVSAHTGKYNRKTEKLDLSDNVTLFHDSGYEFRTSTAMVDLADSSAKGRSRITGQGPGGTLAAEGFRIVDSGNRFFLTGKSRMLLYPSADTGKGQTRP